MRSRQKRCYLKQLREGGTFLRRKLTAKAVGIQCRLTLRWGHLPQIAEGTRDHAPAIRRKHTELLHGAPKLLSLGRAETLKRLIPFNQTAALLWRHVVELI